MPARDKPLARIHFAQWAVLIENNDGEKLFACGALSRIATFYTRKEAVAFRNKLQEEFDGNSYSWWPQARVVRADITAIAFETEAARKRATRR